MVMFRYREDCYETPEGDRPAGGEGAGGEAEVVIAKQRNGPLGRVKVQFHKAYASFYPMAWDGPEEPQE